jgi:hypothetical protein
MDRSHDWDSLERTLVLRSPEGQSYVRAPLIRAELNRLSATRLATGDCLSQGLGQLTCRALLGRLSPPPEHGDRMQNWQQRGLRKGQREGQKPEHQCHSGRHPTE